MLHVLGVDENLEGPAAAILDHIIHGDVERVLAFRPVDLVGLARQFLRPVQRLRHIDDGAGLELVGRPCLRLVERQLRLLRALHIVRLHLQHGACDLVRPVGGAALAAHVIGHLVDILELLERQIDRDVDGLGDRAVDVFLHRRLHHHMVAGRQPLGIDEGVGQPRILPLQPAVEAQRVIGHRLFLAAAIGHQHGAGVFEAEYRLQPGRHIIGQDGNRAGRRDRGQQGIADTMRGNRFLHIRIQFADGLSGQVFLAIEQREGALLLRQLDRGEIGRAADRRHPFIGQRHRIGAAIARAAEDQRVGKAGDAEADAPLRQRLLLLLRQREARHVGHIVHHAHGCRDQRFQPAHIDGGIGFEWPVHQLR